MTRGHPLSLSFFRRAPSRVGGSQVAVSASPRSCNWITAGVVDGGGGSGSGLKLASCGGRPGIDRVPSVRPSVRSPVQPAPVLSLSGSVAPLRHSSAAWLGSGCSNCVGPLPLHPTRPPRSRRASSRLAALSSGRRHCTAFNDDQRILISTPSRLLHHHGVRGHGT